MFRPAAAVAVLAIALALAGCGAPGTPGTPSPEPTAEPALTRPLFPLSAPEVLEYCPDIAAVHFDGDVDAVIEVYVCTADDILSTDDSTDNSTDGATGDIIPSVQRASRVTRGAEELLDAYSQPNAPKTTGACIELAADPLIVWLKTADGITPVYAPVDECGFPADDPSEAFLAVQLEALVEIRLGGVVPPVDPAD